VSPLDIPQFLRFDPLKLGEQANGFRDRNLSAQQFPISSADFTGKKMTVFNLVTRNGIARRPIVITIALLGGFILAIGVIAQQDSRPAAKNENYLTNQIKNQNVSTQNSEDQKFPSTSIGGNEYSDMGTESYALQQLDWRQFESAMVRTWGNRLRAEAENNGRQIKVALPTPKKQYSLVMRIDRVKNNLTYHGPHQYLQSWNKIVRALDHQNVIGQPQTQIVDMRHADTQTVQKAVALLTSHQSGNPQDNNSVRQAIQYQTPPANKNLAVIGRVGRQDPSTKQDDPKKEQEGNQEDSGVIGPVRIEVVPEIGAIIVTGDDPEDVRKVRELIARLIGSAEETKPLVTPIKLDNANAQSLAPRIQDLYDRNFQARQGAVTISAQPEQNSLIVVGPKSAVDSVRELVRNLDVQTAVDVTEFKTYSLKYMSAVDARQRITDYFSGGTQTDPAGNQITTLVAIADYRSNQLIVKASPSSLVQVDRLIQSLDVIDTEDGPVNEIKIFPLKNAVASELALVLQDAINGQIEAAGQGAIVQGQQGGIGGGVGGAGAGGGANALTQNVRPGQAEIGSQVRATMLKMMIIDKEGQSVKSGIMFDVRIGSDPNSNSLVVQGPKESMGLIAELIKQLDRIPDVETQLKVFTIVNGDAQLLFDMLNALFGGTAGGAGAGGAQQGQSTLPLQNASAQDGATLANLRFSLDTRTNAIIASGPVGDLQAVEDLLIRLDEQDMQKRTVQIYRLYNAPANEVATTITDWLTERRTLNDLDPASEFNRGAVAREVIVIPEPFSNSLIVSALPQFYAEVEHVIRRIDEKPPMVKIQCLIAEVELNDTTEFGIELGVQDSLLFDRGIGAGAAATNTLVGFPFNQTPSILGNNVSDAASLATRGLLAPQGLSNLGVGRSNASLGYGGLILSAGNESINVLIRALKDKQQIRILAKPEIMTLNNLQGYVQVGAQVARIQGTNITGTGIVQQDIEDTPVGVILQVTPRATPDGNIVMTVDITKSRVGPAESGTNIGTDSAGNPILVPPIEIQTAQSTIQARDGQSVVFSGLIQQDDNYAKRGIPILSDIPAIGPLFSFEAKRKVRKELLIVLTPTVVSNDDQLERSNQVSMDRMHWCLSDVAEIYGSLHQDAVFDESFGSPTQVVFPDYDPSGLNPQTKGSNPATAYPQPANSLSRENVPSQPATPAANGQTQTPALPTSSVVTQPQAFVPPRSNVQMSANPNANVSPAPFRNDFSSRVQGVRDSSKPIATFNPSQFQDNPASQTNVQQQPQTRVSNISLNRDNNAVIKDKNVTWPEQK
jgi:type II secretory pathway component GspD/PulD (secretin)